MRRLTAALCVASLVACGGDEGSAEELCAALGDGSLSSTFQGFDPTDVPAALDQLRTARVQLGELRDAAPSEVRDDLSTEIDYVQDLIEGLEEVDAGDDAAVVALVNRVVADHPDVEQAAANLAEFEATSCR